MTDRPVDTLDRTLGLGDHTVRPRSKTVSMEASTQPAGGGAFGGVVDFGAALGSWRRLLTRYPRRLAAAATAVFCAILVLMSGLSVWYVDSRLSTVADRLPVAILEQQRVIMSAIAGLEDLALALRSARHERTPVALERAGRTLATAEQNIAALRDSFNFDNLVGAASVHATANPALIDVRLWLRQGVGGMAPNHPTVLALADMRIEEALHLSRSRLGQAQGRAIEALRNQSEELRTFERGATAAIVLAGGLAVLSTLLVFLRSEERRRTEALLRRAKNQAEEASRAKSRFLANMSHELRTPLNAILGFSEIIRDGLGGAGELERCRSYAGDIHTSGRHLLAIVNDVLDLAKIEAGKYEVECRPIQLETAVRAAIRTVAPRAEKEKIVLAADVDPALAVSGDERALRQILINLLGNAVKFTPSGGAVSVSACMDEVGHVVLKITDTGVGIPEDDLDRVLAPFEQADVGTARRYDGTGLGLPLSKSLTELQGGTLSLASKPGAGTCVQIRLPGAEAVPQASLVS